MNYYNTFELDILETYNFKNAPINLQDCLTYFQMEKKQNLKCKICNKYTQISNYSKIYSSPNMFIFSLNRGDLNNNSLIQIPFYIEDKLNISSFLENKQAPNLYELTGIVSLCFQQNKYIYVSFCKSPVDHQWYCYNDENINPVNLNYIMNAHNNNNYIPCILAYKAISNKQK